MEGKLNTPVIIAGRDSSTEKNFTGKNLNFKKQNKNGDLPMNRKVVLTVITAMMIGLTLSSGLASAADGYVLHVHHDENGYVGAMATHDVNIKRSAYVLHVHHDDGGGTGTIAYHDVNIESGNGYSVSWRVRVKNWDQKQEVILMWVELTDGNGNDLEASFKLVPNGNSESFIAHWWNYGRKTGGDSDSITACNPTSEWCNITIAVTQNDVRYLVNGEQVFSYQPAYGIYKVDKTRIDASKSDTAYDLYIDDIYENKGGTITIEDFEDGSDDYFTWDESISGYSHGVEGDNGPFFTISWEATVRNWVSSSGEAILMWVESTDTNDSRFELSFKLVPNGTSNNFIAHYWNYGTNTGGNSSDLFDYCDPTSEWCNLRIEVYPSEVKYYVEVYPSEVKYYVNDQEVYDVSTTIKMINGVWIDASHENEKYDLYIDNIVERDHGVLVRVDSNTASGMTEDFNDQSDDYFNKYFDDSSKPTSYNNDYIEITSISQVPFFSNLLIPILTLGIVSLILRRK